MFSDVDYSILHSMCFWESKSSCSKLFLLHVIQMYEPNLVDFSSQLKFFGA